MEDVVIRFLRRLVFLLEVHTNPAVQRFIRAPTSGKVGRRSVPSHLKRNQENEDFKAVLVVAQKCPSSSNRKSKKPFLRAPCVVMPTQDSVMPIRCYWTKVLGERVARSQQIHPAEVLVRAHV